MTDQQFRSVENESAGIVSADDLAREPMPPRKAMGTSALLEIPAVPGITPVPQEKRRAVWKAFYMKRGVKVALGLLVGIGLLLLVSRFVDLSSTMRVLQQNLTTPRGFILALLSGFAFLLAFTVRGLRWKLFLNPVGQVGTFKAIRLCQVGVFINFLLPVQGGEVAKSLMLKRISGIPVNRSLPTVVMDKSLDLLPAFFLMALVPFLGLRMDIKLWIVLGVVGGLLLGLILFVSLATWKRPAAIGLLHKTMGMLPMLIARRIEAFATGFVDSLLLGARRPKTFLAALLLTGVAVSLEGLFAVLAFWTIGYPISFGTAILGYTVYNMFYILPNPPGQVGSNEAVGLLVFTGLLHLPPSRVIAMLIFVHPWIALLMCTMSMVCLGTLGLTLSSVLRMQAEGEDALGGEEQRE